MTSPKTPRPPAFMPAFMGTPRSLTTPRSLAVPRSLTALSLALLLAPGLAPPAAAQTAQTQPATQLVQAAADTTAPAARPVDLLFDTAHLTDVAAGATLDYAVAAIRTDPDSGETTETSGHIALRTSPGAEPQRRTIEAELNRDGRSRTLDPFLSVRGNPILVIFLEQVLQDVSQATGGSSTYLRNRIRDGLADGLDAAPAPQGTRLVMHPLEDDPNTAELGPYADLEFSFVIDPDRPGMLAGLTARAGPEADPVFLEEVILDAPNN